MIYLRTRHHRELDRLLREAGQTPNESGSFMSTVHRTLMKVRSLFSGLNECILPGLIDGEKRFLGYYNEVESPLVPTGEILSRQRREIAVEIEKMERQKRP